MIPAPFQSVRALRALNIPAVGFSLAAAVAATFSVVMSDDANTAFAVGLPTCALGILWAAVLRWPKTVGKRNLRWGWVASVPLALLNGALAGSLLAGTAWGRGDNYALGAIAGATVGAIFWIPGLIATLVLVGSPLAYAHRLAAKGLAGEERGERIVGLVCMTLSLVALVGALFVDPPKPPQVEPKLGHPLFSLSQPQVPVLASNVWVITGLGTFGVLAGCAAASLAFAREKRRRRFVADVEAGSVAGYRVDDTSEGKVLVRVSQGTGYRVADFDHDVFELDAAGEATRPSRLASSPTR